MFNTIVQEFNCMDKKTKKTLEYGLIFSAFICIIAISLLITYKILHNINIYYIGLSVFKLGLFFIVEFIICAIAIDTIKQQL